MAQGHSVIDETSLPMQPPIAAVDEVDQARASEYGLLAVLLARAPDRDLLAALARIPGDGTPLGLAHAALAEAARSCNPAAVEREFFDLFIGLGRGEMLPYASFYLTGFLHERPLARVRADLERLGIERGDAHSEPEDHIALLCEVMAGLALGRFEADAAEQVRFFDRHLKPWAERFFADLEASPTSRFYRAVAGLGRVVIQVEAEAFTLAD
jgi:TorA maturation chaperone TorD